MRLFLYGLVLIASITACKKEEKVETTRPALSTKLFSDASTLEGAGPFSLLPEDTAAFFFWDLSSPAFAKLLESKWGKSYLAKTSQLSANSPELSKILNDAGLPMDNPVELRKSLREALVFLSKTKRGGIILRVAEDKTFPALKEAARGREGFKEIPGNGFSFKAQTNGQKIELTATSAEDRILITDSGTPISKLSGQYKSAPLKRLSQGAASPDDRIGFGFFDLSSLEEGKEVPVESGFVDISMIDKPAIKLKMKSKETFGNATSTPSATVLRAFPENPLMFVTFQAGEIREIIERNSEEARETLSDSQFAALRTIGQLAVGTKAPTGPQAAILPIPELIIAAESTEPKALVESILNSAVSAMQGFGLPVKTSEISIAGKNVTVVPGALGLSLLVVEIDGAVILSSSEQLLKAALESQPFATLPTDAAQSLKSSGIAKLYLSFPELAKALGSARGMAALTGAKNSGDSLNSALSEENLKALAELGNLISSLRQEGDLLLGEMSYL